MATGNRPAILALVDKVWGATGTSEAHEESLEGEPSGKQQSRQQGSARSGGSGTAPGYGGRKGVRKPVVKAPKPVVKAPPPPRRR